MKEAVINGSCVYLMRNPSMPQLVKIGFTESDVNIRAIQLSTPTGIPTPFVVVGFVETPWPREVEAEVHRQLHFSRPTEKEFFTAILGESSGAKSDSEADSYFLMMITHAAEMVNLRKRQEALDKEYQDLRIKHGRAEANHHWELMKKNFPDKYRQVVEQVAQRQEYLDAKQKTNGR